MVLSSIASEKKKKKKSAVKNIQALKFPQLLTGSHAAEQAHKRLFLSIKCYDLNVSSSNTETDAGPPALSHSDLTLKTEQWPTGERKQSGE